jgi:hypothetical protein
MIGQAVGFGKARDNWDKAEIFSKILGGASIPIFGLLVTLMLQHAAERSRHTEVYANIIAEREKADSDIRAQAFNSLMANYLGKPVDINKQTREDYRTKVMVLDLLVDNFQDYFDPEPLFYELHEQILAKASAAHNNTSQEWADLDQQLVDIASRTSSRQIALLARVGTSVDEVVVPVARKNALKETPPPFTERSRRVALYPINGLTNIEDTFYIPHAMPTHSEQESVNDDERFSVSIEVHEITPIAAVISVFLFKDTYTGQTFEPEKSDLVRKMDFEVSYFATPYMDNTRLISGSRFAIVYEGCFTQPEKRECTFPITTGEIAEAQFRVISFREDFLSQRDRPYLDQLVERAGGHTGWW